jgi:hypothetical protein
MMLNVKNMLCPFCEINGKKIEMENQCPICFSYKVDPDKYDKPLKEQSWYKNDKSTT